ncbi:MAG TPA: hypothetical protein VLU46_09610 [Thermoanaerobaculia bacterium]|nr:hypothetical protein [Thermoanaerobaculia bacterium]
MKGNRVIHTTKGGIYKGDRTDRPRGLTTEQAEDQRTGVKIDERQVREAAQGERQATEWGDISERQPQPGTKTRGVKSDELTAPRFGKRGKPAR